MDNTHTYFILYYSTDYVICPPVHAFSFHVTIVHFTYYAYVSPHDISLTKFKVKY